MKSNAPPKVVDFKKTRYIKVFCLSPANFTIFFGSQMTGLNGCVNRGCTKMKKVKHPLATVQVRLERS